LEFSLNKIILFVIMFMFMLVSKCVTISFAVLSLYRLCLGQNGFVHMVYFIGM